MTNEPSVADHPYAAEIDLERERWMEIERICRGLSDEQRLRPGYYGDPDWSVKDLVGHLGAWMAQAGAHLQRIEAGNEDDLPDDIDALNAVFLDTLRDIPWPTAWTQANAGRAQMLRAWVRLPERTAAADAWVRKAGAEHEGQHLPRLREWVEELSAG